MELIVIKQEDYQNNVFIRN